jgi:hypothetical protein
MVAPLHAGKMLIRGAVIPFEVVGSREKIELQKLPLLEVVTIGVDEGGLGIEQRGEHSGA